MILEKYLDEKVRLIYILEALGFKRSGFKVTKNCSLEENNVSIPEHLLTPC